MKQLLLGLLVLILVGVGCTTSGSVTETDTQTEPVESNETILEKRLASWCQDGSCDSSDVTAVPIQTCGELKGDTDYILQTDLETSEPAQNDVFGCLVLKEPNVSIDCQGNAIRYTGITKYGVALPGNAIRVYESNTTVKNCLIDGFENGIAANAWGSEKHLVNLFFDNNIIINGTQDGIDLSGVEQSVVSNNFLTENLNGIFLVATDQSVKINNNIACENHVGDFTCIVESEAEGSGNIFGDAKICEPISPTYEPCKTE